MTHDTLTRSASKRFGDLPDSDALCDDCRYCLRGQPLDGRCPECGLAVSQSAARNADRLTAAVAATGATDERRASDLRWGPWLLVAGFTCSLILAFLPTLKSVRTVTVCIWIVACVLGTTGILVATRPSRYGPEPRGLRWLRFVVRFVAVFAMPLPMILLYGVSPMYRRLSHSSLDVTFEVAYWTAMLSGSLFLAYAGMITWRAGSRSLAVMSLLTSALSVLVLGKVMWDVGPHAMAHVRPIDDHSIRYLPIPGVVHGIGSMFIFDASMLGQLTSITRNATG